jgi:CRISPR-associated protein Csm5
MNRFVEVVPLALTPLTPIHIGCGEDFEPTNYVIDDGILYHFEPARMSLTSEDRRLLVECANRRGDDAIRAIQRFFYDRRRECRRVSRLEVSAAAGVVGWYERRVGRVVEREPGRGTVSSELRIERTAHHPYTGRPYLPGSSLKGSARTGWLNDVDRVPPIQRDPTRPPGRDESSSQIESQILGGSFSTDPFRLVEFADAAGADLKSRVVFAVDRRKQPRRDGKEKDLAVNREVIVGGQFRSSQGEIRFKSRPAAASPQHVPSADKCIRDFALLARACNQFYRTRLEADLEVLDVLGEGRWVGNFRALIAALSLQLNEGRAILLRVGRHSGAESVTLDRHRWIRIIGGNRGTDRWAREATTIWLATESEDRTTNLRPFGWVLLERADNLLVNDNLSRWCEEEVNASSGAAVQPSRPSQAGGQPERAVQGPLRRGDKVVYRDEPATIRDIAGTEARIDFQGGDIEWVPLSELKRL